MAARKPSARDEEARAPQKKKPAAKAPARGRPKPASKARAGAKTGKAATRSKKPAAPAPAPARSKAPAKKKKAAPAKPAALAPLKARSRRGAKARAADGAVVASATLDGGAGDELGLEPGTREQGVSRGGRGRRPRSVFARPSDVKILVVDDEPEVLNLLVPFLRKQGYAVSEAQDGDQALEKILTELPNIVVLDVMMPGLSGWEISRYVRERAELDPVRIIMATGIGEDTNAATSPLYGADAYIDKPFPLDALHRKLKDVIARIEAGNY